ncbi:MAG TPA: tetratricopeptide repeat protein [Tepidisphaeraceae bacterium]|nr:tetratricopeptide repeat protein [Tepidisphaeraceae bacterium]
MSLPDALRPRDQKALADSQARLRESLREGPSSAAGRHRVAVALHQQGKIAEASEAMRQAVALAPRSVGLRVNLAAMLGQLGKLEDALAELREAIRLGGDLPELHNNMGVTLEKLGRVGEAAAEYRRAVSLRDAYPEAHCNLGNALRKASRIAQATGAYRRALALRPGYAKAYEGLAAAAAEAGDADEAVACYRKVVELEPANAGAISALLYVLHYCPEQSAQSLFAEHREWDIRFGGAARAGEEPVHSGDRNVPAHGLTADTNVCPTRPERARSSAGASDVADTNVCPTIAAPSRLRIGYVSPDFRDHTVPRFISAALEHHNRAGFEVFCYCDVERPDDTTCRLRGWADTWREIRGLDDPAVEAIIRADAIDILVDLRGHGANNRLTLFARKPAPVQVSMVGYFNTTGLPTMDYRITDAHMDPPGQTEALHSEKLARLANSCWCYTPDADAPDVAEPPSVRNGFVTFGSLNKIVKVSEPCARLWARVLEAVPNSRLLLTAAQTEDGAAQHGRAAHATQDRRAQPAATGCATIHERLARLGLPMDRVILLGKTGSRREYLGRFAGIDIALDTFPFCGITTTCDVLWMGVPAVSLAGETSVSRSGKSILHAANLPELAAAAGDGFVQIAADLARDQARLRELRMTMRTRLVASPLLDHRGFAANLESAYRGMWRAGRRGENL